MAEEVCVQNGSHLINIQPEQYIYKNQYYTFQDAMGNSHGFSIFFIGLHNMDEVGVLVFVSKSICSVP